MERAMSLGRDGEVVLRFDELLPPEADWPRWTDGQGVSRQATERQMVAMCLSARGFTGVEIAKAGVMSTSQVAELLRRHWVREWLTEQVKGELAGAVGVALRSVVSLATSAKSEKVRLEAATWVLAHGSSITQDDGTGGGGGGRSVHLHVHPPPARYEAPGRSIVVEGMSQADKSMPPQVQDSEPHGES